MGSWGGLSSPVGRAQSFRPPEVQGSSLAASPVAGSFASDRGADRSVAVLGDSLATGAATHPALAFDAKVLWDVLDGRFGVAPKAADIPTVGPWTFSDPLEEPTRLWPGVREYFGGPDWVFRNALHSVARSYLDTEEYSWGYLVARGLSVPAKQLLIAAENGARVETIPRQIDRVLDATGGTLPARILMLFTGNDLCGPSLDHTTTPEDYGVALARGFSYLLRNGKSRPDGTDVYLLSHLGILQLLYEPSILSKSVRAFGTTLTCGDLRQQGYLPKDPTAYDPGLPSDAWWFAMLMPPNPAAYCPTLFGVQGNDAAREEHINALANRIRAYRDVEARELARAMDLAAKAPGPIRFHHVLGTADLQFQGEDIAQDCFHLSPLGQAKVARTVLKHMGSM